MMEVPLMAPNELREMPKGEFVLLKTFCRSTKTHMPLFTEWGITLEEKYRMPERAIREIKYMDVPELMKKLNKKAPSQESEAKKEDEIVGNLPLWAKAQQKEE
jgi:type IV secretion system protein VirD4